ncbi:MAG: radical SAM protein [Ignavibacteriae bacterium]|nr:radical SAM protein [Ignavibacteriota bacterium]
MSGVITIIVQTTNNCNLSCDYCYVLNSKKENSTLRIDNIELLIDNCSKKYKSIEFCWHGGEPLLLGIEFFSKIRKIQKKYKNIRFTNLLQTNGTLLNRKWIEFFKNNSFRIGISLDLPIMHSQKHRFFKSNIKIDKFYPKIFEDLKSAELNFGILCVITKENVRYGNEIFNFLNSYNISTYSLLPLIRMRNHSFPEIPTNEEVFELYKTTYNLWMKATNKFSIIEPLDSLVKSILGEKPYLCTFAASCLKKMITITADGNIVPCGSLINDEFILGNIFETPLHIAMDSVKADNLRKRRVNAIDTWCKKCKYTAICNGGCRESAYWFSGNYEGYFPYCESRKMIFKYLHKEISSYEKK